ncbi:pyridoxal phosphate-dependent decarboxylase family protein [Candidatus Entotheonella palauensis]|nr:aspartate aminotransferase family protein [Candidatus Entotheonella palauensis]
MARAFPSLRQMEDDLIAMALELLHGGEQAVGNLTSGGTESIFMAVKTARDWARAQRPDIDRPEIVLPYSAHPAFDKAAHYLNLHVRRIPVRDDFRADPQAMAAAVTGQTIMLAGSAPCFPYGVIDPIADLSILAQERQLWLHVDACVGGFLAPFVHQLGYPVPTFDFQLPGVYSMSADLHKYGFAAKGASTVLYRDDELRQYQPFACDVWPNGTMVTPTFAGTRPGGAIAAAWAVMHYLGVSGYQAKADTIIRTRQAIAAGIEGIEGLKVWGQPDLGIIAYGSDSIDIVAVADELRQAGWFIVQTQRPKGIHMMLTPAHAPIVDDYLRDVQAAVNAVRQGTSTAPHVEVRYA